MLPNINQVIRISTDDSGHFTYKARVADLSEHSISLEMPVDEETGKIKFIPIGSTLVVWYISGDMGQFSFKTKVLDIKQEQVPLMVLENPQKVNRVQRRNYLRVPSSVEIAFKILDHADNKWYIVKALDISGGGMRFLCSVSRKLAEKQEIIGWVALPFKNGSIQHVKFQGQIVRVLPPVEGANAQRISVEFKQIQESMRATVIRYCYEKQVELKKWMNDQLV